MMIMDDGVGACRIGAQLDFAKQKFTTRAAGHWALGVLCPRWQGPRHRHPPGNASCPGLPGCSGCGG